MCALSGFEPQDPGPSAALGSATCRFFRGETRRYRSRLQRPAGELPHDLAHLVVEDELGLRSGVWGVIVAGGMSGHAVVVAGRRKPQATRRGREIIARAG